MAEFVIYSRTSHWKSKIFIMAVAGFDTNFYEQWSTGPPAQTIWWSYNFFSGPNNNLELNFFTLAMCFHIVNFVKPQNVWQEFSSRMMIDLNVSNSWLSWLRTRVLFRQKDERGYSFSGIIRLSITRELRRLFISLGHVTFMTRARYYGGPQDHWIWMFWWSDIISGGLGPPDHRQSWTLAVDPQHRYSNKAERVDCDIYDEFKLFYIIIFQCFKD